LSSNQEVKLFYRS